MIRAGRSKSGQPVHPDPAEPDLVPSTGTGTSAATLPDEETTAEADGRARTGGQAQAEAEAGLAAGGGGRSAFRRALAHTWVRHLILLVVYLGAGIAATWPRFTYLADGKLPATADVSSFVWNIWWSGHQLLHLSNPFFTRYMAAPVGTHLAFSTLMPLAGWLTGPVTVLYGPSASFTLLTIVTPGLLCYAMYRAARLWLNEPGAIIAGAFFGLSSMLLWQNWYHVNIAIGTIFLPATIEAAVRLRRQPHLAPAIALGIAIGASILINQESTVVAIFLAAAILLPWLVAALFRDRSLFRQAIRPLAIGAAVAIVVASPELIGMVQQAMSGGAQPPPGQLALNYTQFGASLPTLFAPSPRLGTFGLGQLASAYSYSNSSQLLEGLPTFGVVLSGLALLGVAAGWRKRSTWAFLALWIVSAALALGTSLTIGRYCRISQGIYHRPGKIYGQFCHQYLPLMGQTYATKVTMPGSPTTYVWKHVVVSDLMPYTWLVRIPGLSGLREADRFALVGLIGAAMLAGLAVQWLSRRTVTMPLIAVIVALGVLESGWSGAPPTSLGFHGTMPTTLPALDRPLTRDHTKSIVVDVPYGLRGGVAVTGSEIAPNAMLIATHDRHPRAISYTAWVSKAAIKGVAKHAFFRYLYIAEHSQNPSPAQVRKAAADLGTMNVGWVVEWRNLWTKWHPIERLGHIDRYLEALGFRHTNGMCLVNLKPGEQCPHFKSIWLWQYKPGHRG
ncbi:MAG TPA: hypothetical protein VMU94_15635 [Streptosporangiaceae bacterium]|nr:hypothetical protein [Streptosporangiaceae bacterium]